MLFGPVFFASIGLKTSIDSVTGNILLFSLGFVIVGLLSKIIGCGLMAKACKFNGHDALKIGVGSNFMRGNPEDYAEEELTFYWSEEDYRQFLKELKEYEK